MKQLVQGETPKKIKKVQFSVMPRQDTLMMSQFRSSAADLYMEGNRNTVENGVLDSRLGVSDKAANCGTCGLRLADCVGHFAYIQLVLPVYHVGYFKQCVSVLKSICKTCGHILLDEKEMIKYLKMLRNPNLESLSRMNLIRVIRDQCKKKPLCPHCASINGTVRVGSVLRVVHDVHEKGRKAVANRKESEYSRTYDEWCHSFKKASEQNPEIDNYLSRAMDELHPLRALELFMKMSPEDCELVGIDPSLGRPEQFIWQTIPVPPVCIRPSVQQDNASNEDDLTTNLSEIINLNNQLISGIRNGNALNWLFETWLLLQGVTALYINSETPGLNKIMEDRKPTRGLCQRLKGKQGRFRQNLSGKRVDFSARTVISPDPNLSIDQVAIPQRIAMVLTFPERVTRYNVDRMRVLVRNGVDKYPGANYYKSCDASSGFKRSLRFGKRDQLASQLKVGDTIERHLQDGDIVLFNRQPSLHKLSIMAHRVKVLPWRTFRFNECVCTPYNADFDGDEMNVHVPQTEEARAEALELMNTKLNIVTPRNGEPIIAATQDFISGCYFLTKRDVFFNRAQFCELVTWLSDATDHVDLPPPAIIKPERLWTGKQVFNMLMCPSKRLNPVRVNLECRARDMAKPRAGHPNDMSPNDGFLVIQNSEIMCGVVDKAAVGDGNKQSIFGVILRDYGRDYAAAAMNRVAKITSRFLAHKGFSIGISDVTPGELLGQGKDVLIQEAYDRAHDLIDLAASGRLENNPGCTSEQTLEANIGQLLSSVRKDVGDICTQELSMHNTPLTMARCGAKGSVINVCQMVACVGQQIISGKRVPNGFQDRALPHFPKYSVDPPAKGFVRNSFFSGLSATEFFFHAISGREGLVDTAVKTAETGYMQRRLMKALEDLSVRYDGSVRASTSDIVQFKFGDDQLDPALLEGTEPTYGHGTPINFDRVWLHARALTSEHDSASQPLSSSEILDLVQQRIASSEFASFNRSFSEKPSFEPTRTSVVLENLLQFIEKIAASVETALAAYSTPGRISAAQRAVISNKVKVTAPQLHKFLDICHEKYARAQVEPGTAVGAIGAESIGEPGTQMTLKTFHFAGVASMNVTLGVPRIKEIINASKDISTPIITAALEQEDNETAARIVKAKIEKTTFGDVMAYIEQRFEYEKIVIAAELDLDTIKKLQLNISLASIAEIIKSQITRLKMKGVIVSSVPEDSLVLIQVPDNALPSPHALALHIMRVLPNIVVRGVPTLSRAVIKEKNNASGSKGKQLLVEGVGLKDVMSTDGINGLKTTSNHVMEVEKILGIEAARSCLIHEISFTMESHGLAVDPRHTMLLGDVMTYKGQVLGITRFGVAKMKDSTLMLASFEKTTDHLFHAAFHGKDDPIEGVSECIIMGQPANHIGSAAPAVISQRPALKRKYNPVFESALVSSTA